MKRRSAPLRHRLFLILACVTTAAFIWPWYASVDRALPLILGLPRPFAWLIGWVLILFSGLLVVYLFDRRAAAANPSGAEQ